MQAGVVVSENHGQNIFNTQGGRALQHIAQQDFTHADPAHIVSDINTDFRTDVIRVARIIIAEAAPCQQFAAMVFQDIKRAFAGMCFKPRLAGFDADGR